MQVRGETSNQTQRFGLVGGKAQRKMVRPRRESSEDIFDALSDMEYQLKHSDLDLSILFEEDSE
ncbi:MAG TPA: hypothetical protein DCS30_20660 [Rhizobiales bacterium]|nr:hypothetical protein [Hyphomicrobiales bacterium]